MISDVTIGLGIGILAGLVFFGGLEWTVARLPAAKRPLLLAVSSFFVRFAVMAGLIVGTVDGRIARVLASLGAIVAVRTALIAVARRDLDAGDTRWI